MPAFLLSCSPRKCHIPLSIFLRSGLVLLMPLPWPSEIAQNKGRPSPETSKKPRNLIMYRIVAQSFPNNEIRVVWSSLPNPRAIAESCAPDIVQSENSPSEECDQFLTEENPSLPLSLAPNSKTQRSPAGFGRLPDKRSHFGLNAKRCLIRRGAAMECEAPPEECLFLTGTLPGSTEDSFRAIAEWSSYIVHRLKAWISTYAPGKLDFYCWEYQKRGALHLHYCVWIPSESGRSLILSKFRQWWIDVLHKVGEFTNVDLFRKDSLKSHLSNLDKVRAIAEVCRKSPARYLAKYLSKSAEPKRGNARLFCPARFWGTSRPLKALCDSLTVTIEIVEGGYQKIRRLWEDVTHACASSDSVTYGYRHKVGSGHTLVSYPNSPEESQCLLNKLESFSPMAIINSHSESRHPFEVLKVVKIAQMQFFTQLLESLPNTQQGLHAALTTHLNWMQNLTPSVSPEPLSNLLAWMARTADLRYILQYFPNSPFGMLKRIDAWLDIMETETQRAFKLDSESKLK